MKFNVNELLEDFGLEYNASNLRLIKNNISVLQLKQEVYRLHMLHPNLHSFHQYSVAYELEPICLTPPSRNLDYLDENAKKTLAELKLKYFRLISPKNPVDFKNPDHMRLFTLKIFEFYDDWVGCSWAVGENKPFNFEPILVIGDELWYEDEHYMTPLSWVLKFNPDWYRGLKEAHETYLKLWRTRILTP